jgi:hypothetical protein
MHIPECRFEFDILLRNARVRACRAADITLSAVTDGDAITAYAGQNGRLAFD